MVDHRAGDTAPEPKHQFASDIAKDMQSVGQNGSHIILVGELNERIGARCEYMASVCQANQLYDVFLYNFPGLSEKSSYVRSFLTVINSDSDFVKGISPQQLLLSIPFFLQCTIL